MPNENSQMGELQISLKDMLMRVLLSWRAILVWMVVGAVLLGGLGAFRSYRQRQQAEPLLQGAEAVEEEELDTLRDALTDKEALEAERSFQLYQRYWRDYESLLEYQENSLLMQLDPMEVAETTVWYQVDNHYQVQYPILEADNPLSDIVFSYSLLGNRASLYQEMAEALGWETETSYLQELVQIDRTEAENGIFSFTVRTEKAEDGEKILDVLMQAVEAATPELQQRYGAFDIAVLEQTSSVAVDQELLKAQQTQNSAVNSAAASCRNVSSYMGDEQEAYYEALIRDWQAELVQEGETPELPEEPAELPAFQPIQVKFIVLGAFLGAFLVCAWAAVRYLFSARMRVAEDLPINFHVPLLGVIPAAGKKKKALGGVDRWIRRLFGRENTGTPETVLPLAVSQVKTAAAKAGIGKVYVTGAGQGPAERELRAAVCQALEKVGLAAEAGEDVLGNADSLERMTQAKAVVLVEAVGESRYGDLREVAALCRRYQVPVLGGLVLQ